MLIYKHKIKKKGFLDSAINYIVIRRLSRLSKRHVANGVRQLVVFSFDHIAHRINVDGAFEKDELYAFFEWMNSLGVDFGTANAMDIGANIGNHSIYFSDYFSRVDSYEPNPPVYEVLCLNAKLVDNVHCHNYGLSDRSRTGRIKLKKTNIGASSVTFTEDDGGEEIELRSIDSLTNLSNVKLVKIDVEGHELHVLNGAKRFLRENSPIILFEHHYADFLDKKSKVVDFLKENGYENFATVRKHPYAYKVLKKASGKNLMRSILPQSVKINLTKYPEPGTYVFIVAIPSWLDERINLCNS